MRKKMKNIKLIFAISFLGMIILASTSACKKDVLDTNKNPNDPELVDIKFALPSAEAFLGYTMGNQLQIMGGLWSHYWTQGPNAGQYKDEDAYLYKTSDADRPWTQLYTGTLMDLNFVYRQSLIEKKNNYAAIALFLEAYTFQVATDAWGDVPYTDALKTTDNLAPKFDNQSLIYADIEKKIDEGLSLIDPLGTTPGADDIIYGGDMDLWTKFANTLKLKIYLRQIYKNPAISSKISALMTSTTFLDDGESAIVIYSNQKLNQNPIYTTNSAIGVDYNLLASSSSINLLDSIGDPRLEDYYFPNDNGGVFAGITQGQGRLLPSPQSNGDYSYLSDEVVGSTSPVILMSSWESLFLQAEANARGLGTGEGQSEYEYAIELSWAHWTNASSLIATDLPNYLTHPFVDYTIASSTEDKVKFIINQKWIAMNGTQNFESWTEFRRTGYPNFLKTSSSSILPSGVFPSRLLWPDAEVTSNPNVPANNTVDVKVWWDNY